MKRIKLMTLLGLALALYVHADIKGGITVGGDVGLGMPFECMGIDTTLESGASEIGWTIRPAIILGKDNKFAIGIEYTYKYQKYTLDKYKYRDITKDYPWTGYDGTVHHSYYTYTEHYDEITSVAAVSHNIGISFTEKLSKNPNWWTIGYDTDSKGPFFNANIGVYHGPDDYNANFMLALYTYISAKKMSIGLTLNFQAYTDYYSAPSYSSYSTPSYSSYTSYRDTTTYYGTYYPSDTTTYYGSSDRVHVRGHYRHYKSGKVSYVRPHTRSYPGRGRSKR